VIDEVVDYHDLRSWLEAHVDRLTWGDLVEALEERGMSQADLGARMARPLKTISEIATGKAAITPETAIQLERTLGISAALWLGLESRYREALARERDHNRTVLFADRT
jgi:addiction module HigA family antidote